jgi:hypothetical protein
VELNTAMNVTAIARARAEREESMRAVAAQVEEVERIAFELGLISGRTVGRGPLSKRALRTLVDNAQMLYELIVGAVGADSADSAAALVAISKVHQAWALVDPSAPA